MISRPVDLTQSPKPNGTTALSVKAEVHFAGRLSFSWTVSSLIGQSKSQRLQTEQNRVTSYGGPDHGNCEEQGHVKE